MPTNSQSTQEQAIKTAFFTGHRNIDKETSEKISFVLDHLLRVMASSGVSRFLAGGALGFDTLAALAVLRLKSQFPSVTLELILPCKTQTKLWSESDVATYNFILSQADRVQYLHESYTSSCMHDRNRLLADTGDIGVAFFEHSGGGTAYTVGYALKNGKEIINVAEML